ncbi:hypothetical protein D3C80_1725440 [compost metagenome]
MLVMPGLMVWWTSKSCRPTNTGRRISATTSIHSSSPACSLKKLMFGVPWARSMIRLR